MVELGWNIRLHAPLEYDLIMQVVGPNGTPEADLIEAISYSSKNVFFRSQKFRMMLIEYRNNGCHISKPKPPPTPRQIRKAIRQRVEMSKGLFQNNAES